MLHPKKKFLRNVLQIIYISNVNIFWKFSIAYFDHQHHLLSCHSYLIALTLKKITHSAENTPHLNVHNFDNSRDIRRLLVQLEETERRFDIVYKQHRTELECVLELRRFEVDFRELQVSLIKNSLCIRLNN